MGVLVRRAVAWEGKVILPHNKYLEPGAVYLPENLLVPIKMHGQYSFDKPYGVVTNLKREEDGQITMDFDIWEIKDPQLAAQMHEMYWPSFYFDHIQEIQREPYPVIMSACLREVAMVPDQVKGTWGDR